MQNDEKEYRVLQNTVIRGILYFVIISITKFSFLFFLRKRPYRPVEGCWRLPYSGTLRIFSFSKFRKEAQRNEDSRNSGDEGCKQEDREAV